MAIAAATLPGHVSAFSSPACLTQAAPALRAASSTGNNLRTEEKKSTSKTICRNHSALLFFSLETESGSSYTAPSMMAAGESLSRRDALTLGAAGAAWTIIPKGASAKAKPAPAPVEEEEEESDFEKLKDGEGLEYSVIQEGKGAKAKIGDLVAIRFKATYNGQVFRKCRLLLVSGLVCFRI